MVDTFDPSTALQSVQGFNQCIKPWLRVILIWWPKIIPKQFDLWLTLDDSGMTFDRLMHNSRVLNLPTKFGSYRAFLNYLTSA